MKPSLNHYFFHKFPFSAEFIWCACESKETTFLTMRGLCPGSFVDIYYEPVNVGRGMYGDGFIYKGWYTTTILFDDIKEEWVLSVGYRPRMTRAVSYSSYHSFLLGKSNWIVENDSMIIYQVPMFSNNLNHRV